MQRHVCKTGSGRWHSPRAHAMRYMQRVHVWACVHHTLLVQISSCDSDHKEKTMVFICQQQQHCSPWCLHRRKCTARLRAGCTCAAQPPYAKIGSGEVETRDLSLEFCSCEAAEELLPH